MQTENLPIFIRLKPNPSDCPIFELADNRTLIDSKSNTKYTFEQVFSEKTQNQEIF